MYELHLGLKQYPVIFIYISQVTNNVDHLFMNLWAICMSVLAKLLSFFIELSFYYWWVNSLYVLDTICMSDISITIIFFQSVACNFISLMVYFNKPEVFHFN